MNNEELNMYKELIVHKRSGAIEHCYGHMCESFNFCPVCKDYEPCMSLSGQFRKDEAEREKLELEAIRKELDTDKVGFVERLLNKVKDVIK